MTDQEKSKEELLDEVARLRRRVVELEAAEAEYHAALQESEARLHTVIANAPVVLWIVDRYGTVILREGQGMAKLGHFSADMIESSGSELMPGQPHLQEYLQRALAGENVVAMFELPGAAFEARYAPYRDESGQVAGVIVVATDITERRRAERAFQDSHHRLAEALAQLRATQQQALQQERMAAVGQLAAGIAHDFNNLLTSIIGYAELLRLDPAMSEPAQADLARIVQQGQRGAHLIRQVLDFSRKSTYRPQPLDLVRFLTESARLVQKLIPEQIMLHLEIEPVELPVKGDFGQLQQMLTNLVNNAREAMPHGGELHLRLALLGLSVNEPPPYPELPPGSWAVLSVADTGRGISLGALPHIFEPFFTTKETGQGAGLGLAQVYGIVKQHGGYIDVSSRAGQGTTFTIYLPCQTRLLELEKKKLARLETNATH
jgi:PAS domain S-box-containing protein